ncbi:MAG: formate dehydrogenase accessory protein FdhE [Vicinamibacterales bacterium]|nr:formate dehydrogenase accessory protein FdhE [Vicinamibacterales bacterium]
MTKSGEDSPDESSTEQDRLTRIRRVDRSKLRDAPDDDPPPTRRGPAPAPGIAELTDLKAASPDLASAIDLQIELLTIEHRILARVSLPTVDLDAETVRAKLESASPLLQFEQIPLECSDVRLALREMADALRRHDAIDADDYATAQTLSHRGRDLVPLAAAWYAGPPALAQLDTPPSEMLAELIGLALRPSLRRCADAFGRSVDWSSWRRGRCPLCGGEPALATITPDAQRLLICGRCQARWPFHDFACPHCDNADKARITSFASRDGRYRLYGCDACRRYLKAYDARQGTRPALVHVDSIATLPLDAAALQRGYQA